MFDKVLFLWTTNLVLALSVARPLDFSSPKRLQDLFEGRCNVSASRSICPDLHFKCCCVRLPPRHSSLNQRKGVPYTTEDLTLFVICADVEHIPPLPENTEKLTLERTRIKRLNQHSFNKTRLSNSLTLFSISHNDVLEAIMARTFSGLNQLRDIYIENDKKLRFIDETAFSDLPNLQDIKIKSSGLEKAEGFSHIGGPEGSIRSIILSHNLELKTIQSNAFSNITKSINVLEITSNPQLEEIQDNAFYKSSITSLVLENNEDLRKLSTKAFSGIINLKHLSLDNTPITSLPSEGLQELRTVSAKNTPNLLRFPQLLNLKEANLTYSFHCCALASYGFENKFSNFNETRIKIDCDTGEKLEEGWEDPIDDSINELPDDYTNYPYYYGVDINDTNGVADGVTHYNFYQPEIFGGNEGSAIDHTYFDVASEPLMSMNSEQGLESTPGSLWSVDNSHIGPAASSTPTRKICYENEKGERINYIHYEHAKCFPLPDAFSPCENLLGHAVVTTVSWGVAWLTVFGNVFIVFMLLAMTLDRTHSHPRNLSAPKFLILNLAIADFCMGIYILSLSIMDSKSSGHYFAFAAEWQTRGGCDVVGFLSIFASQLSVYTLSVISLERWYAIRFAIQLERRMTLKCSRIVMAMGWVLCIVLAAFPLTGVNSYKKNALCLPMDVEKVSGKVYAATLLSLDLLAFVIVVWSYLSMFGLVRSASGRQSFLPQVCRLQTRRSTTEDGRNKKKKCDRCFGTMDSRKADKRVAKKMAILVFTDFACFFPVSFFALVALAGLPLISISKAKILMVIFYPFNACCNPFLYAILTKSFRQDVKNFIKTQKHCFSGDDRQKAPNSKIPEKRNSRGSRLEEGRKTMVYVEGDIDRSHVEAGAASAQAKITNKERSAKNKSNFNLAYSFSSTKSDLQVKSTVKTKCNYSNNNVKRGLSRGSIKSENWSRSLSEESILESNGVRRALTFIRRSLFKHKKSLPDKSNIQLDSIHNSFETQTTANGAISLDEKNENVEVELVENKMVKTTDTNNYCSSDIQQQCESFI